MSKWYVEKRYLGGNKIFTLREVRHYSLRSGEKTVTHTVFSLIIFSESEMVLGMGKDWLLDKMPSIFRYREVLCRDDFLVKNRRRQDLIIKDISGDIELEELQELEYLTNITREYLEMDGSAIEGVFMARDIRRLP